MTERVVLVTQGDQVVYSRAFGLADAASGRRADEATAFYIASSTKALVLPVSRAILNSSCVGALR